MPDTRLRVPMYTLFFLSGISGLVYQIVWTRLLVLVFGNTLLATSTVLTAFMAGLAAGSYVLGKYVDRRPRPLINVYALLEAGIGLFALAFPFLLAGVTPLYTALYRALEENVALLNLVRFGVCFALIFIPTFLMGGTLPVLLKRFVGSTRAIGHQVGVLYGLNTAGAVAGTLACGYLLLRTQGMQRTTWIAAAINLGVAVFAWALARSERPGEPSPPKAPEDVTDESPAGPAFGHATVRVVLLGIAISGFCALAYEVLWVRMLNLFVNNNVYTFTAILATFLTGIAVGSLIYARLLSRARRPVRLFAALQVAIGLLAYATPFVFNLLHEALFLRASEALTLVKTSVIMLPPTLLMGIALPLAVQICQRGEHREGTSVGTVYALNTVGAILGAFVAGFVLVPVAGLQIGVLILASLNLLAGVLALTSIARARARLALRVAFVAVVALAAVTAPTNLFRGLYQKAHPSAEILHYEEGKIANVVVYDFVKSGFKDLFLNGVEEASSRLWHVQLFKMLGILPVMTHADPDDALMIAFGAGMSAGACVDQVNSLDCVDLNPDIGGVAEVFREENRDVINHPNLNVIVNDGRNALLLEPRTYSLIISDATNPKTFDSWTLYTREFYELVKSRLEPDGVFCQWVLIPLPGDAIQILLKTFRTVFPHASFWCIYGSTQCMMLATPERLAMDYQELSARLEPILEPSGLAAYGVEDVDKFLSFFMLGEDALGRYLDGHTTINTDDLPHAQFRVKQDIAGVQASLDLVEHLEPIRPYLVNLGPEADEAEQRLEALGSIAERLHWGFLLNNATQFRVAAEIASRAGIHDDQNVATSLKFDRKLKEAFLARTASHPSDANAFNSLGYIYWQEGELENAAVALRQATSIKPDFAVAHATLARVYIDAGWYDMATETLLELRELHPTESTMAMTRNHLRIVRARRKLELLGGSAAADLYVELGRLHEVSEDLVTAAAMIAKAVKLGSRDPVVHAKLGELYERLELVDDALGAYRTLAQIVPGHAAVQDKLRELMPLSRDAAARRRWMSSNKRLSESPPEPPAHPRSCTEARNAWGESPFDGSVSRSSLERAARLFERATEEQPDHVHAYVAAARIYEQLGEFSAAAAVWRRGLAVFPDDMTARDHVRRLELLEQLDGGGVQEDRRPALLAETAFLYRRDGELELAGNLLREALEAAPGEIWLWRSLAENAAELGDVEEAANALDRALALAPEPATRAEIRRRRDELRALLDAAPSRR